MTGADRARAWLHRTYGDLVVLAGTEPLRVTERAALFGCRYAGADEPMLAAALWVPAGDRPPFPAANAAPLDEDVNHVPSQETGEDWRWRVNARNCVVAADAAVDGNPASAGAWRAADESPGWWDRLVSRYFPAAEVAGCDDWAQAGAAVVDGGPGTRAVVWLRRRLDGGDLTGHLLYARYDEGTGQALVLDPQLGTLASTLDDEVDSLVVARFHRAEPLGVRPLQPWEGPAEDFPAAVAKAAGWLDYLYGGQAVLVAPDPADETRRGWLFACTTSRFLDTGDWRDQMLDAALLVPKAAGEHPFGLPNRDPWTWLRDWDGGVADLPAPPEAEPGAPTWFPSLTARIGRLDGAHPHPHWAGALGEIHGLPPDALALIWLRRKDYRDRETVGHLLWARNGGDEIHVLDPTAPPDASPLGADPFELRVFRVGVSPAATVRGG
ncbi:YrhB domain-containing protein [Actinophytocola sp.]|uniref:YrhB domain-containing protein n=1 Tax=Actinophytocola sp. TaxID=1872138 RepID=UPI002D3369F1|nr:YrhB domain-containing protein [Actinophytocola sp.]HYQ61986.1 YrhB domain-containing protein [Actinophytocola sp.]